MEKGAPERVAESPKMSMGSLRCQQMLRPCRPPNRRFTTPSLLEQRSPRPMVRAEQCRICLHWWALRQSVDRQWSSSQRHNA